jgi:hypothetical protein
MSIIQRVPWRVQPQVIVPIDHKWGLRPVILISGAHGLTNLANRTALTLTGNQMVPRTAVIGSTIYSPPNSESMGTTIVPPLPNNTTQCTMLFVVTYETGGFIGRLLSLTNDFGNFGFSGNQFKKENRHFFPVFTMSAAPWVLIMSHRTDTGEMWGLAKNLNTGVIQRVSDNNTLAAFATTGTAQFNTVGADQGWPGHIALAMGAWNWLPETLGFELLNNPWQLFAPLPRRIWAPSAPITGIPTLSLATLVNVTQTTATPRVTVTF